MSSSLLLAGWVESVFGGLDASDGRMGRSVCVFVVPAQIFLCGMSLSSSTACIFEARFAVWGSFVN